MTTMTPLQRLIALILLFIATCAVADATKQTQTASLDKDFPRSSLQIATPEAKLHTFRIWVADTEARRSRGLMFVKQMDPDAGMLFVYPQPQRIAMWMKNTFLSLDMLFVDPDGRVVRVVPRTTPQSLDTIDSGQSVLGVVELNAGVAEKLQIRAGSQVIHPAFLPR